MAIFFNNNAEGGTQGMAVTAANSGGASGTAFSTVTPGTGTLTFDNSQVYSGNYAYNLTAGAASNCSVTFPTTSGGGTLNMVAVRAYLYLTGYPTAATQLMQYFSDSTAIYYSMNTVGKVLIQDYSGAAQFTASTPTPLNTWVRIEMAAKAGPSTTTGIAIASMYVGDDTASPIFTYTNYAANVGAAKIGSFRVGKVSNTGNWSTMYLDDIQLTDMYQPIGPLNGSSVAWFV